MTLKLIEARIEAENTFKTSYAK